MMSTCVPSIHFLEKKEARGLDWHTIREVLEKPQVVEPTYGGRCRYVRGDLAVVVRLNEKADPVLVTVLLRQGDQWTDEDVRKKLGTTRQGESK